MCNLKSGDRVKRRLANGKFSERRGTVQTIYDGEENALVCWTSKHARLAYQSTRCQVEQIKNLVRCQ